MPGPVLVLGARLLTGPLTKQVLQYGLVLVPEAIEGIPARTPIRQGVPPNPTSTGKLVKVLTGAHPPVKGLQDFSSHSNAGLREAGTVGGVCSREHGHRKQGAVRQSGKGKCFEGGHDNRKLGQRKRSWGKWPKLKNILEALQPPEAPQLGVLVTGVGPPTSVVLDPQSHKAAQKQCSQQ